MTGLFDEGAGGLDSEAFQTALDEVGLEMGFSARRDAVHGSLRMLAERSDEAVELARLAVNAPRFDADPIARIRSQLVAGIRARERDPRTQASRRWDEALYGDHPYARPDEGTVESLQAIGADDLKEMHRRLFAKGKLHIGIVGAIDADGAARLLDRIFGELPQEPGLSPIGPASLNFGQEIRVDYDLPQSSLTMAWPGVPREDPDFFAAHLMNHILGGGTFSSRLYQEIREKRGLAYGVDSYLVNNDHADLLMITTASAAERIGETLAVIRHEVARMAAEGPSAEELEAARKTVIGGYAVSNLTTSGSIASTLVELQRSDLGIDYIDRRAEMIGRVTLEDTRRVAARLFSVEPSFMILGPAGEER
jgi:zinc protease